MDEPNKFHELCDRAYKALVENDEAAKLTNEELELVAAELQKPDTEEKYLLIRILGYSHATAYQPLVERFLISESDPYLASAALQVLCNHWGFENQYLQKIQEFIQGVSWDEHEDVRLVAISTAGEHLRKNENKEFLQTILEIFKDENEDHLLREAAYSSLARAVGRGYAEIPSAADSFDLVDDIDPLVIEQVEQRLNRLAEDT